jgi:hypothetical protein
MFHLKGYFCRTHKYYFFVTVSLILFILLLDRMVITILLWPDGSTCSLLFYAVSGYFTALVVKVKVLKGTLKLYLSFQNETVLCTTI